MKHFAEETFATEPVLDLAAMAAIVRELLTGDAARRQDGSWLRERAEAAGLEGLACQALEALRVRLAAGGAVLANAADVLLW